MGGHGGSSGYSKSAKSKANAPYSPQNPAPNGHTGTVDGSDISGSWVPPSSTRRGADIESVMDAQGFRGKPRIITDQAEFDKAAQAAWGGNGLVLVRGIGAPDQQTLQAYSDSLTQGDWYVRCDGGAVHGFGQYAVYRYGQTQPSSRDLSEAQLYARSNGRATKVFSMTLDPSAKIGEEKQLRSDMYTHNAQARQAIPAARQRQQQAIAPVLQQLNGGTRAEKAAAKAWANSKQDAKPRKNTTAKYQTEFNAAMAKLRKARDSVPVPTVYRDVGVYAAAKGYDFYYDKGTGYSVTLNRTKLIIKG